MKEFFKGRGVGLSGFLQKSSNCSDLFANAFIGNV